MLGNFRPDMVSFLPSMRYYAGNWATSQWLFRKGSGAEERLDERIDEAGADVVGEQLAEFYDRETADFLLYKGLAFRSMHSHGRALNGLLPRAVDDVEDYDVREGELISGVVLGWNFGDGHFHDQQLLEAVQERCEFEPGELRVVTLESQPAQRAAPALPDLRRRDRAGRGGLGRRRRHGRAPALAGRVVRVPGRGRAAGGAGEPGRGAGMSTAIVVGSGPNGLACAAALAQAGVEVTVLEAAATIGGGTRSAELTAARPAARRLLGRRTRWRSASPAPAARSASSATASSGAWPEVDLAHPLRRRQRRDDGALDRARRPPGWARTARAWRRLFGSPAAHFDALNEDILRPILHLPRHPLRLARFGIRGGGCRRRCSPARWKSPATRALFGGVAAHSFSPLTRPFSAAVGMALI